MSEMRNIRLQDDVDIWIESERDKLIAARSEVVNCAVRRYRSIVQDGISNLHTKFNDDELELILCAFEEDEYGSLLKYGCLEDLPLFVQQMKVRLIGKRPDFNTKNIEKLLLTRTTAVEFFAILEKINDNNCNRMSHFSDEHYDYLEGVFAPEHIPLLRKYFTKEDIPTFLNVLQRTAKKKGVYKESEIYELNEILSRKTNSVQFNLLLKMLCGRLKDAETA